MRSRGAEVGIRTKAIPNLDSSISLFYLHQDSELFFDGDTGDTTAGLPSQRTGIEITNDYRLRSWLHVDGDIALSRARFLGFDGTQAALYQSLAGYPQAQIGNAPGNYVYNAPWMVASAGITLGENTGWFGALRWRYISSRPLTEDGVFQSPPSNLFNGAVGYRFDNGWSVRLDAINLLNSTTDNATYAYGSLLTTDALYTMCKSGAPPPAAVCANGVMDYIYHPIEPLSFRLTLSGPLELIGTIDFPAMAAELRRSIAVKPVHPDNYDWTGFYIGAHVDSAWSKISSSTVNAVTGAAAAADSTMTQWHGGLQLGYDAMLPIRVSWSALRPTCRPATRRRPRPPMPPGPARSEPRCSTAKPCAGGLATPSIISCSTEPVGGRGRAISSSEPSSPARSISPPPAPRRP